MQSRPQLAPGKCISLSRGLRRIVAGNAGMMTGPGTNTYLVGEREVAVIDPGPDDDRHLENIIAAAAAPIRWVLVTHTHRDHSPLAAKLARRAGARIIGLAPPRDGRQDDSFTPDQLPSDGEILVLGDAELTAVHTPGHASNCVCYLMERESVLITGDHVLEGVSPVILPPDGDMSAYLASIEKLFDLKFDRIAPGHGDIMERGKEVLEALRAHRLGREDKVFRTLRAMNCASIEALTPRVYDDVPADRHAWARLTLEAHLIKLTRDGRVRERDGTWQTIDA
jgi:glyoxylase-like metal-dependent hydrolase (beta-lactamase superfamily II)